MLFDYIINILYLVASSSWFNMIMSMDTKIVLSSIFNISPDRTKEIVTDCSDLHI